MTADAATARAAEAATNTAAEAATNTTAEAATNTAAATPAATPATSSATRKQSAKDKSAKDLDVGASQADEEPAAGTSKPESGQDQSDGAAATLQVVADAEPAPFIIHKPTRQKKRKSSATEKAFLRTPDAGAGTSTGLQAADQDGATAAAVASDPEAADGLTASQPVTQKRHRLSHSTGPADLPAPDLATTTAEKPKAKKKKRKSVQAPAADTFPAESLAVAEQADEPVPETATATEPEQALAPEGAPVFQKWLSFPELAALHGMPEMAEPGYFSDRDGAAGADDDAEAGPSRAGPSAVGEAGPSEPKPAPENAAAKPPKATKRRKQSTSKVSVAFCAFVNTVSVTLSSSAQH